MIKLLIISENTLFIDLLVKVIEKDTNFLIEKSSFKKTNFLNHLKEFEPSVLLFDGSNIIGSISKKLKEFINFSPQTSSGIILKNTNLLYLNTKSLVDIGFKSILTSDSTYNNLVECLKKLHEGNFFFTNDVMKILLNQEKKKSKKSLINGNSESKLSDREVDILLSICDGKTSKEASETLYLSPRTVQWHRANLMQKVGAKNASHLIQYAIKNGYYQSL